MIIQDFFLIFTENITSLNKTMQISFFRNKLIDHGFKDNEIKKIINIAETKISCLDNDKSRISLFKFSESMGINKIKNNKDFER